MDLGIKGKKALVLASSKGLGKSVAHELAIEGCAVTLCGRDESTLSEAAHQMTSATGAEVHHVPGDVSVADDRRKILDFAISQMGGVDILVTNSGGPPLGSFEQHDEAEWLRTYQLLLESAVSMIKGVLPHMKSQQWGRIITITSQAVKQPVEGLVLSNAVRISLLGLVKPWLVN